jgi:hypothetical protein
MARIVIIIAIIMRYVALRYRGESPIPILTTDPFTKYRYDAVSCHDQTRICND